MTRNVCELYESCRLRAVQVPSDGIEGFQSVFQKYRPGYLLLDENWIKRRPYLRGTNQAKRGEIGSVEFQFVGELGQGLRLYRLEELYQ